MIMCLLSGVGYTSHNIIFCRDKVDHHACNKSMADVPKVKPFKGYSKNGMGPLV